MLIKTKTLWNGLVGVNQRKLEEAIITNKDLVVQHKDKMMTIKNSDIETRMYSKSKEKFQDRFGGADYYLIYYLFREDKKDLPVTLKLL